MPKLVSVESNYYDVFAFVAREWLATSKNMTPEDLANRTALVEAATKDYKTASDVLMLATMLMALSEDIEKETTSKITQAREMLGKYKRWIGREVAKQKAATGEVTPILGKGRGNGKWQKF